MQRFAAWSARHPAAAVAAALAVAAAGLFALGRLPLDLLPYSPTASVRVQVSAPGLPSALIEAEVTRPLAAALADIPGIAAFESTTRPGEARIELWPEHAADAAARQREIEVRVEQARAALPAALDAPTVVVEDAEQLPAVELVIAAAGETRVLQPWVEGVLAKQLAGLAGVAQVRTEGAPQREIRVAPEARRLASLGLSFDDLIQAIRKAGASGRLSTTAALAAVPVSLPGGEAITLSEVARVTLEMSETQIRVRDNGREAMTLAVTPRPEADGARVAERLRAHLAWMRANGLVPEGIELRVLRDRFADAHKALKDLALAWVIGALSALLIMQALLRNLRGTLALALVLIVSGAAVLIALAAAGRTLNVMTAGGLVLAVGLPGLSLALKAARATRLTALLSAPTLAAAAVALLLAGGAFGTLFGELILVVAAGALVSRLTAAVVAPWAESRAPRARTQAPARGLVRIFSRPNTVLIAASAIAVAVLAAAAWRGVTEELLPARDSGRVAVRFHAETPPAQGAEAAVRELERSIRNQGAVAAVTTDYRISPSAESDYALEGRSLVELSGAARQEVWMRGLHAALTRAPVAGIEACAVAARFDVPAGLAPETLSLRIRGADAQPIAAVGEDVLRRLSRVPGLCDLRYSARSIAEPYALRLDEARAAELGVDVAQAGRALAVAVDGIVVADLPEGEGRAAIRVRLAPAPAPDADGLARTLLRGEHKDRRAVYLRDVAALERIAAPAALRHDRSSPMVEIAVVPAATLALGAARKRLWAALEDVRLPEGFTLYEGGAGQALVQGHRRGAGALAVALAALGVLSAVGMRSLRLSAWIALPTLFTLGLTCAALPAIGMPWSWPMWAGLILLAGVLPVPAAALVERLGSSPWNAHTAAQAVRDRWRPLAAMTLIVATGPVALIAVGPALLKPLATVFVFGLLLALPASLVLLPAIRLTRRPRAAA